jgi:hypothetical protein
MIFIARNYFYDRRSYDCQIKVFVLTLVYLIVKIVKHTSRREISVAMLSGSGRVSERLLVRKESGDRSAARLGEGMNRVIPASNGGTPIIPMGRDAAFAMLLKEVGASSTVVSIAIGRTPDHGPSCLFARVAAAGASILDPARRRRRRPLHGL